jgi:hypothetical protein
VCWGSAGVLGLGQGVLVAEIRAGDAVQQHVHLGDGPDRAGRLLAVEPEQAGVAALLLDVLLGEDEHTARAAAGVVHALVLLRLDQAHHHADHGTRGVELAALLAGGVGEVADQVLVGGTEKVGELEVVVAQAVGAEVDDQLAQLLVRQLGRADLAGKVDVLQDAVEARVVLLQAGQGLVQVVPDVVVGLVEQVAPARLLGDVEGLAVPVLVVGDLAGIGLGFPPFDLLGDHLLEALLEHIRATLQEQHPEDVLLELRGIHLAPQDVGGAEEVAFELIQGEGHVP